MADSEPAQSLSDIKGDSRAWFEGLCEALSLGEIKRVPTMFDDQRIYNGQYLPDENTVIAADELKKFCDARGRKPEFLA